MLLRKLIVHIPARVVAVGRLRLRDGRTLRSFIGILGALAIWLAAFCGIARAQVDVPAPIRTIR